MSASNKSKNQYGSNSNTSTTIFLTGMSINFFGINKRDIDQISRIVSDESVGTDESKRRKLSTSITASHNHHFHHDRVHLPQGRTRPLSPESSPPVIKPCNYLMKLFQNKGMTRIDSFSIEQALFFEPYHESEIKTDILQALRSSNVDQLRSLLVTCQDQDNDDGRSGRGSGSGRNNNNKKCECRNQFGENLLHLACRMGGISGDVITFLIQEAQVPLNVRDRFGRTPLHHACMSSHPNFDNIEVVIRHVPRILLFEDDNGKIPFDLIPSRCDEAWTRFLSETKNILYHNNQESSSSSDTH